eukprot:CAMPEP_0170336422 /NCGR_PEP_ID=MMETSP0116_2-20130129/69254_1 /TAXON_ID=400756 /ORGANISM="Durinskia baltica, Strain CSIRO CS-38" /LENGTH=77 /DNA_ID=CAMNT_0010589811 /DNA_START=45 /DNA_END=278 /DNA_ORIENTATION=-
MSEPSMLRRMMRESAVEVEVRGLQCITRRDELERGPECVADAEAAERAHGAVELWRPAPFELFNKGSLPLIGDALED